jgi:hypothetical protein
MGELSSFVSGMTTGAIHQELAEENLEISAAGVRSAGFRWWDWA